MKLVTYERNGLQALGAIVDSRVVDLPTASGVNGFPTDMLGLLSGGEAALQAAREALAHALDRDPSAGGHDGEPLSLPVQSVRLLAPVPRPGKLICIGLNYRDHAEELNMKVPERPVVFAKYANTVVGPEAHVVLPPISSEVDYEAELAVVIGRKARQVSEGEALDYVAGYTMLNDVSARDLQMRLGGGQWVWGKTLDTFAPMGPAVVTRDEVEDPDSLDIAFRLNGRTMQSSNTRNLIFGVRKLISFLSQGITLEPGDVIATGTPAGVGVNRKPPVFLKPGDRMEVEVEKLGVLANPVVAE